MTFFEITFLLLFLSQIFLISYYYPNEFIKRVSYILDNYPPSEYPKFYPKAYGYDSDMAGKARLNFYRKMNIFAALVGFAILSWMLITGYRPDGSEEMLILFYFMLQVAPLMLASKSTMKHYKLMRQANENSVRRADLQPRRLSDFISLKYLFLAVLLYAAQLVYYLYWKDFTVSDDPEAIATIAGIAAMNLIYIGVVIRIMYGKRLDPHQSEKDKLKTIGIVVKSTLAASIGVSIFLIINLYVQTHDLHHYQPILMSIYFQLIVSIGLNIEFNNYRVDDVDFEVYRADNRVSPT